MARTDHSFSAGSGSPAAAPAALRGRGAVTNVRHRFESIERIPVLQDSASHLSGETLGDAPTAHESAAQSLRTTVTAEQARKLITRNDSPDIPFELAVNPYRGCEHGCVYCYARPTHAYLGYSPGLDFETRLVAKANAVQALRAELCRPGYRPSPINIGSATDVYQPIERDWRLTRGVLELMLQARHPITIVTKNALIERDLDVLRELAARNLVAVYVSITTLDTDMARTLEPRASAPWRRVQTVRTLSEAGIPTGVLVAPVIPFINDESLERILEQAAAAGANYASYTVLRLPWEVRPVFEAWLAAHFPDRAQRVLHRIEDLRNGRRNDSTFGTRMRGTGIWADLLRQRFDLAARKRGLNRTRVQLDSQQFAPPAQVAPPPSRDPREAEGGAASAGHASHTDIPVVPLRARTPELGLSYARRSSRSRAGAPLAGQLPLF